MSMANPNMYRSVPGMRVEALFSEVLLLQAELLGSLP